MEILFEIIITVIFEGSIEGMKMKKLPMWFRILCAIIVGFMFTFVISILGFLSIIIWNEYYHIPSILFLILDLVLILFTIKKVKKEITR